MDFKSQYKHPLWQKKRLEAMESAGFCCEMCEKTESQLHVHHKRYVKGRMVWEYETSELSVLCFECHEFAHSSINLFRQIESSIPTSRIEEAAFLLAGWISGSGFVDLSSIKHLNKESFVSGELAARGSCVFGPNVCSILLEMSGEDIKKLVTEETPK